MAAQGTPVGKNITVSVDGGILTIKIDIGKRFGPSASGKTIIVASTSGNASIPGTDIVLGLNAYTRAPKA